MSTKSEINARVGDNHRLYLSYVNSLSAAQYVFAPEGRWSAGQQTEHLVRAIRPVTLGLRLPRWLLKLVFGKANRPSRSYDSLVAKYQNALANGGKASKPFQPSMIAANQQSLLTQQLEKAAAAFAKATNRWSENELDDYIMPHPLLGKLTIREMMYFTAYHVEHHHKSIVAFF